MPKGLASLWFTFRTYFVQFKISKNVKKLNFLDHKKFGFWRNSEVRILAFHCSSKISRYIGRGASICPLPGLKKSPSEESEQGRFLKYKLSMFFYKVQVHFEGGITGFLAGAG